MNLDSLTFSLLQISRLVANLNKENYKQTAQQLSQLVSLHGVEADRQVIRCLIAKAASSWDEERPGSLTIHSSLLAEQLLSLLNHPARATVLTSLIELRTQENKKTTPNTVERISKWLKLSASEDAALSLALRRSASAQQPAAPEKRLQERFLHLVHSYLGPDRAHNAESDGLQDCSPEVLQTLLINLAEDVLKILPVTKDLFLKRLRADFPREVAPIILAPLLYADDTSCPLEEVTTSADMATAMMECSLADSIKDIGYAFTSSVEECKKYVLNFGVLEPTAVDVSRIILTMIRFQPTQEGPKILTPGNFWMNLEPPKETNESWNPDVFVKAVKELGGVNWKEVIIQLDQPEFFVPSRQSLNLLFTILRSGLLSDGYSANVFPVEYLCRRWQNSEGQFSLISNILRHPDIFSFADFPLHPVAIDMLKTAPEDNKEIATWRGLYLIELLLYLSERGYYVQVHELFKFPLQHCPDILLLALLQITSATVLRQELLTALVPVFLGNHPNSGVILQHAWHTQNPNLKPVIMHAMADWYIRGDCDQTKLSRILDIAQDLKALSLLLNVQSFPFVIDLACLASRREYLKLDKWLTDKIRDHGEAFVTAIVKFLQRRCPGPDESMPKLGQLPPETVGTLLACLQLCISNVQQDLQEAIYNVIANQTLAMTKLRQMMPARSRLSDSFNGSNLFNHIDPTISLAPAMNDLSLGGSFMNGSPSRVMASNSPFVIQPHITMPVERVPIPVETPRIPDPIPLPDMAHNASKDIEEEANGYFQKIYNHPPYPSLSIDEVLEMLKKFQDSTSKREREVFSCMLRNLFEEYKFFPQYPEKELHITAQLFGGIIERGLVPSYVSLGLALRFVLDALRKSEGTKMYFFGIVALDKFKTRLKDYHMYCEHVRALPHFKQFPPHLIEYVEYGLQSQEPPSKPSGPVMPVTLAALVTTQTPPVAATTPYKAPTASVISKIVSVGPGGRPSIANATNIDTLLTADAQENITAPPEAVQDKTFFIFNNLSQLNLQTKCDELKESITEEYYPWLSQYLVMKRASIEFNFHALYSNFLDVLQSKTVNKLVAAETYRNIKVLLRTEKGIENFSDRSLLKNLGHWLGVITLGRNQPILHNDLDLKSLLLEAYHKGQQELLYVVPFVAKIMESCSKGCFKPPNPWTMALINVLAELHQEPDLKLNLKFEVEVLCKNLSLDITELKPAVYLKNSDNLKTIQFQLSLEKVKPKTPVPSILPPPPLGGIIVPTDTGVSVPIPAAFIPTESVNDVIAVPEPKFSYHELNFTASTFEQRITFSPHVALFQTYPHLKQLVKPSIERSIQEWIHPVVDRSIKQVVTTCELIVRKDFALEPNETRVRLAAHHMMRALTAAVAMVACRAQIVTTIAANLKTAFATALLPASQHQKEMIEGAAALIAADNMELACAWIQRAAADKALPEIDKRLADDYELRRLARRDARPLCAEMYEQRIPARVQPRVGGPTDAQVAVYEEFARHVPGFQPLRGDAAALPAAAPPPVDPAQVYTDELSSIAACAEAFASRYSASSLAAHAASLAECATRARRARDGGAARALLQRAVEGLLASHTSSSACEPAAAVGAYRELHVRALQLLGSARVYAREPAPHAPLLAHPHHYDLTLAQLIDDGKNYAAVTFAMQLVQLYLNSNMQPIETFPHTIEALVRVTSSRAAPEGLASLLEALKGPRALPEATVDPVALINQAIMQVRARDHNDPPELQEKTECLMRDWRSFLQSPLTELEIGQNFHLYVHRMDASGVLESDETMSRFLRLASRSCVSAAYRLLERDGGGGGGGGGQRAARRERCYAACDAFAKLAALLVKHTDGDGALPKLRLLNKVLGIIAGCLLRDHEELGEGFRQLPYHRLFLVLFLDMLTLDPLLEALHYQVVTAFCQALHAVRPSVAAGFCYSWLDLVAHRTFIDRVLVGLPQRKGWELYSGLLLDLFAFLEPLLRAPERPPPVSALHRGALRVLLVLRHDFPHLLLRFCDQLAPPPQLPG